MYHTSSKSSPINVHGADVNGCVSAQFRRDVFYNVPYTHAIIFKGLIFHDFIFEPNLYISWFENENFMDSSHHKIHKI